MSALRPPPLASVAWKGVQRNGVRASRSRWWSGGLGGAFRLCPGWEAKRHQGEEEQPLPLSQPRATLVVTREDHSSVVHHVRRNTGLRSGRPEFWPWFTQAWHLGRPEKRWSWRAGRGEGCGHPSSCRGAQSHSSCLPHISPESSLNKL